MKVCMLAYAHYINDARIKSYVQTLEEHGNSVDVIALRSEGEASSEKRCSGTTLRILDKYQGDSTLLYACSYLWFLLKAFGLLTTGLFRGRRYDAVHVHNMPNALVLAALVPKLFGAKLLLDVHDLMTVNYMAKFECSESSLLIRVLKQEQRWSAALADQVICADHNQRDYLVQQCGIRPEKVAVLMNLPNEAIFAGPRLPKSDSTFRIVYHGTIAHRLGIDLMIRAMALVRQQIPAELYIFGAGDFLPESIALASQLHVDDVVRFSRSFFPVEKIAEMVSPMHLGLIGNRRNLACDQFMLPVKLLEYVYLGVPVIAPRLKVIQRYFDESAVRFYEPENVEAMANAIVELYRNPAQRTQQAAGAARFYERFNVGEQAQRYLSLFDDVHPEGAPALPKKQAV